MVTNQFKQTTARMAAREEIMELIELDSPAREKTKKTNKVNSVDLDTDTYSVASSAVASASGDIVNIFSVTPRTKSTSRHRKHEDTVSEISDDVFIIRPSTRSYKEKIAEHIKRIKKKASTSSQDMIRSKSRMQMERIRRENESSNAEVESVRNRFNLNGVRSFQQELENFLGFVEAKAEDRNVDEYLSFVYAENLSFNLTLAEKECLFRPTRKIFGQSINPEAKQRSTSELNYLKQRLLIEDEDKKWFDSDGQLVFNPDPLDYHQTKPSLPEINPDLVHYTPSLYPGDECEEIVVEQDKILNLYLSQLVFLHHPLFSLEHVFASKLRKDYEEYKKLQNLELLRRRLEELREGPKASKKIKKLREQYILESQKYREIIKSILDSWRALKKIRETQQYSNTNIRLIIKKEEVDHEADSKEYDKFIRASLKELSLERLKEEHNEDSETSQRSDRTFTVTKKEDDDTITNDKDTQSLTKTLKKSLRPPGEPIINFTLVETGSITETPDNPKEINRRTNLDSTRLSFRILCDDVEVCKTGSYSLNHDFFVDLDETFSLKLTETPKLLAVEVITVTKALHKRKVTEVTIPVPDFEVTRNFTRSYFEKDEALHFKHEGLGSGIDLKTAAARLKLKVSNRSNSCLKTNGYLEYTIEWEKTTRPPANTTNPSPVVTTSDQNVSTGTFKLNQDLSFSNLTEIDRNLRLQLLRLRNRNEVEFEGLRIPNRIKEIPQNILSEYKLRKALEARGEPPDEDDDDRIESSRNHGRKYLRQVYVRMFQACKNIEDNLDYESVVNESVLFYLHAMIKTLLRNFFNWFRWRPKIARPFPVLSRKAEGSKLSELTEDVHVVINIFGARNVPNRTRVDEVEEHANEVKPFVKINYKNMSYNTAIGRGANHNWDESLTIKLETNQTDYLNPNSLEGDISINLYDENDPPTKKPNDNKRTTWLGGIDIPLSVVCSNKRIKGFFKLRLPYVLLGYETEPDKQQKKSTKFTNTRSMSTYLNLEISVEPNVPLISPNLEEFAVGDVPYVHEHIIKWNKSYNSSFPSRKFSALAVDTNMKSKCITRYLKPLEPPQLNSEEFNVSPEQCLKFVSLIPFIEANHFCGSIWLSSEQLLHLMIGSNIDHVVALVCYFLALKIDAWLLLGCGVPYGSTAYVLVREFSSDSGSAVYYIYDVFYGEKYGLLDELCPLQSIYCVANNENIWANIQRTDSTILTRLDFTRRSDWLPLFDNDTTSRVNFVKGKFSYRLKVEVGELERYLEKQIKKQISKSRQLNVTVWNSSLGKVLKMALKSFEMATMYSKDLENLGELSKALSIYEIRATGFAINASFLSVSHIVKKIKSLDFHMQGEGSEFAVAVYIHSYPNQVLSVWVFLANVTSKGLEAESVL